MIINSDRQDLFCLLLTYYILIKILCIVAIVGLVYIIAVPTKVLIPIILAVCIIGSFSVSINLFDIGVMFGTGFLGYFLLKFGIPLAPLLLAFVLAPILETSMRQSFIISRGDASIFFTRPISLGVFFVGVLFIVLPFILQKISSRRG